MGQFQDITGQRFGRLTVLSRSDGKGVGPHWACRCDCGNLTVTTGGRLRRGHTQSCGCYQRQRASEAGRLKPRNPEGRMTGKRRYHHLKAQGLCPFCGGPRDTDRTLCTPCRTKHLARCRETARVRTSKRRAEGKCPGCGGQLTDGHRHCPKCRETHRQRARRRVAAITGKLGCPKCLGTRDGDAKLCSACLTTYRERRRDRISKGLCCHCGSLAVAGKKWLVCETCWFKRVAAAHTGTTRHGPALKELWDRQGGRCAYTGTQLAIGVNAALDHVWPRSRGGRGSLDNLQWVCKPVNLMKNDCTHDEFLRFCRLVAQRFPAPIRGRW